MSKLKYRGLIGLEIHVQLAATTKMFCRCALEFAAQPNSRVCPVCLAMPGVLPVMNKKAVEYSILTGLALNCQIAEFTKWDRKSYYYPDLPKNYQISQYDLPLASNGYIEIEAQPGRFKRIGILRAHLEEDAGKNTHTADNSQVDLNRAGTPLLEIVTEPEMSNGAEVRALAVELQRIVRYLGVSEADMQKGHMRFEPNINVIIDQDGKEYRTPIAEIKNLNSFRALERSVDYEIRRQFEQFKKSRLVMEMGNKSTRGWDDANQVTVLQREKEEAHDYRYFPDPDLLPVKVTPEWLAEIRGRLCELPLALQRRYVNQYGLSDYDAGVLTVERGVAELFEAAVQQGADPKRLCNLITQAGMKLANEAQISFADFNIDAGDLARLAAMIDEGAINASAADKILAKMIQTGEKPEKIAEDENLIQKSDESELEAIVDQAIAENPEAVEQIKTGGKKSKKARGFLMGQVMQKTRGQANPKVVSAIFAAKLG